MGKLVKGPGYKEGECCPFIKKDGEQCKKPKGSNTEHLGWGYCKWHGGTSPAMNTHAAKEQLAARMVAFGTPKDIEPGEALLGEVRRSAGIVDWLEEVISTFTQIDRETLRRDARDVMQSLGIQGREVAVWVEMYREERKMLRAASVEALRSGIAERQVRLAEEHGRLIAHVLQSFLDDPELGLSVEQRRLARPVAARHLQAIGSG